MLSMNILIICTLKHQHVTLLVKYIFYIKVDIYGMPDERRSKIFPECMALKCKISPRQNADLEEKMIRSMSFYNASLVGWTLRSKRILCSQKKNIMIKISFLVANILPLKLLYVEHYAWCRRTDNRVLYC